MYLRGQLPIEGTKLNNSFFVYIFIVRARFVLKKYKRHRKYYIFELSIVHQAWDAETGINTKTFYSEIQNILLKKKLRFEVRRVKKTIPALRIFILCRAIIYKHTKNTQTQTNNLWILRFEPTKLSEVGSSMATT